MIESKKALFQDESQIQQHVSPLLSPDDSRYLLDQSFPLQTLQQDDDYIKVKQIIGSDEQTLISSYNHNNKVYRPFQSPPDFDLAFLHGKAKKIGKINSYEESLEQGEYCICCHLPYHKTPFLIGEHINNFASLGSAFTLFFYFNKQMIALMWSYFLIGGLQGLIDSYIYCSQQSGCESFLGIIYSRNLANSCSDEFKTRQLMDFIAFWVLFIGVILCKIFQDNKHFSLKKSQASHADYTIMMKNIHESNCEKELKTFLEDNILQDRKVEVVGINRIFKIQQYYQLAREKIRIVNEYESLKIKQTRFSFKLSEQYQTEKLKITKEASLERGDQAQLLKISHSEKAKQLRKEYRKKRNEIEQALSLNSKKIQEFEELYSDYSSEGIRTDMVLVTFNKSEDCSEIKKKYIKRSFIHAIKFKDRIIKFTYASEPLDIIWENLETQFRVKVFRRSLFLFFALMLTGGSLIAVSAVTLWQKELMIQQGFNSDEKKSINQELQENVGWYALSVICMIIVTVINSLLTLILSLFSFHEKHSTFTQVSVSVSMRLSWISFINTALVPCVIILILTSSEDSTEDYPYLEFVTQNIFFIFIGNAIIVPITVLLEPEYIWKKLKKWWIMRTKSSCTKTQQELNEIFEDPEFLIQEYYAIVNRIVLSGFFYATMLSLGILIKCLTMILLYWAFKFTFVRHSAYPKCLSNSLNSQMQQIMFFIPIIYVAGNLTNGRFLLKCENSELYSTYNIISLSFGISLIFFHNLFIRLFSYFYHSVPKFDTYEVESHFMGLSYSQTNPITRGFDPENKHFELEAKGNEASQQLFVQDLISNQAQKSDDSITKNNNSNNHLTLNNALNIVSIPDIDDTIIAHIDKFHLNQRKKTNPLHKSVNSNYGQNKKKFENRSLLQNYPYQSPILGPIPSTYNHQAPLFNLNTEFTAKKNTHSSIIDYALASVLMARERSNQIISAAFKSKLRNIHKQSMYEEAFTERMEESASQKSVDNNPKRDTSYSSF